MNRNRIYVSLKGRIGNQLFIYAFAKKLQEEKKGSILMIDDSKVLEREWINSLKYYNLPNVKFIHNKYLRYILFFHESIVCNLYKFKTKHMDFNTKYVYEKKHESLFSKFNLFVCENGFINISNYNNINYIDGYFQSEKYFNNINDKLMKIIGINFNELNKYPNIEKIKKRNTICISIKVEHNIGSDLYDVCTNEYWKKAIKYIKEKVDNPLFFICSDNIDYVINNIIDVNECEYIVQANDFPTHITLNAMSNCKHFIIGNTTFAWWAQFLCAYENKIVIAPKKWMKVDMPIDIYQDRWVLL